MAKVERAKLARAKFPGDGTRNFRRSSSRSEYLRARLAGVLGRPQDMPVKINPLMFTVMIMTVNISPSIPFCVFNVESGKGGEKGYRGISK